MVSDGPVSLETVGSDQVEARIAALAVASELIIGVALRIDFLAQSESVDEVPGTALKTDISALEEQFAELVPVVGDVGLLADGPVNCMARIAGSTGPTVLVKSQATRIHNDALPEDVEN